MSTKKQPSAIYLAFKGLALCALPRNRVRVAAAILSHYNMRTGQCDPSVARLAWELGIARSEVLKATRDLCAIDKLFEKDSHGGHSHRASYRPLWPTFSAFVREFEATMRSSPPQGKTRTRDDNGLTNPDLCEAPNSGANGPINPDFGEPEMARPSSTENPDLDNAENPGVDGPGSLDLARLDMSDLGGPESSDTNSLKDLHKETRLARASSTVRRTTKGHHGCDAAIRDGQQSFLFGIAGGYHRQPSRSDAAVAGIQRRQAGAISALPTPELRMAAWVAAMEDDE